MMPTNREILLAAVGFFAIFRWGVWKLRYLSAVRDGRLQERNHDR